MLDVQDKVVTITGVNNPTKSSVIKSEVKTSDGTYNNILDIFKFDTKNTYSIKFTKRSKILLYSKKISN